MKNYIVMEDKLTEFIAGEGLPTDDEIDQLAQEWQDYIRGFDLTGALRSKKDFQAGMIFAVKRLKKHFLSP